MARNPRYQIYNLDSDGYGKLVQVINGVLYDGFGNELNFQGGGGTGTSGTSGNSGSSGVSGTDGIGVPTGGSTGQVLAKIDGTNYNTQWVTPTVYASTGKAIAMAIVFGG